MDAHRLTSRTRPEVLPVSQHLRERLEERRARNTRPKRSRRSDIGPEPGRDDDIFLDEAQAKSNVGRMYDSSPLAATFRCGSEAGTSVGRRRTLGVKDMDDQIDRITKENFSLKLELEHRRERAAKLQEQLDAMRDQVERAELLEKEHAELLQINLQLVAELEKRDEAIKEAGDIICELEDKVAEADERRSQARPSTSGNADSGYAGTETHEQPPASSPLEANSERQSPQIKAPQPGAVASSMFDTRTKAFPAHAALKPRREPSALGEKTPSGHALQSMHLENAQDLHPVKSFYSLLSKREKSEDDEILNSPRLSSLSESSFPSIYSPRKQIGQECFPWETPDDEVDDALHRHLRQDSINRVSQWMSGGNDVEETPSKRNRASAAWSDRTERAAPPSVHGQPEHSTFQSFENPLAQTTAPAARQSTEILSPLTYASKPPFHASDKQRANQEGPNDSCGPPFGELLLRPTPESSTKQMLRASHSSVTDDETLLDTTPQAVKGYDALEPGVRTAPKLMRSSVELNAAFLRNLQHRKSRLRFEQDGSSSDEDDEADARSETIKDLSVDYDGFPDGNSILFGTPSRFLKHGKPPAADMLFDGSDVSPPNPSRWKPQRRQSSAEVSHSPPRKPSLGRAETSPISFASLDRVMSTGYGGVLAAESSASPTVSSNSRSSSNRTVVQQEPPEAHATSISPKRDAGARSSVSPVRALSQKTQKLFRRLSNSHATAEARSPQHNSAGVVLNKSLSIPNKQGRTSTRVAERAPLTTRSLSSREGWRPDLQTSTKTEAEQSRPASVAGGERGNPVKSTRSMKRSTGPPPPNLSFNDGADQGGKNVTRRRGSIREVASSAKRPWR